MQRRLFAIFAYDDGRQGGAPEGATGMWRQVTDGFYVSLPTYLHEVAARAARQRGTQAKIMEVDFEAATVKTVALWEAKRRRAHGGHGSV